MEAGDGSVLRSEMEEGAVTFPATRRSTRWNVLIIPVNQASGTDYIDMSSTFINALSNIPIQRVTPLSNVECAF